jgi:type II secretory pathway pseudopilin PulG
MRSARRGLVGKGPKTGATLVELLVTIVIVAIGLVGLSSAFMVAYQTQRQAQHVTKATAVASGMLEEMTAVGFHGIDDEAFPPTFEVEGLPLATGTVAFEPYPDSDSVNQYLVTVTIAWGGGPGYAGQISMPTVICNHS